MNSTVSSAGSRRCGCVVTWLLTGHLQVGKENQARPDIASSDPIVMNCQSVVRRLEVLAQEHATLFLCCHVVGQTTVA